MDKYITCPQCSHELWAGTDDGELLLLSLPHACPDCGTDLYQVIYDTFAGSGKDIEVHVNGRLHGKVLISKVKEAK